jgi:hypothetical protein
VNGIAWSLVQKMMLDAPSYDYDSKEKDGDDIRLTKDNAAQVLQQVNSLEW